MSLFIFNHYFSRGLWSANPVWTLIHAKCFFHVALGCIFFFTLLDCIIIYITSGSFHYSIILTKCFVYSYKILIYMIVVLHRTVLWKCTYFISEENTFNLIRFSIPILYGQERTYTDIYIAIYLTFCMMTMVKGTSKTNIKLMNANLIGQSHINLENILMKYLTLDKTNGWWIKCSMFSIFNQQNLKGHKSREHLVCIIVVEQEKFEDNKWGT